MSESSTDGLSPLMDMRIKLTEAQQRIAELEGALREAEFIIRGLMQGPHTNEASYRGDKFLAALKGDDDE